MSAASIRDALRGARLALSAVQAGWEEGQRQKQQREAAGIPLDPVMLESLGRIERTVTGQQMAVGELERFADLRSDLAVSLRRHIFGAQKHGVEWMIARVAEDLGL